MIGGFATNRRSGNADLELLAFRFADSVFFGAGRPKYIKHQRVAFPAAERSEFGFSRTRFDFSFGF